MFFSLQKFLNCPTRMTAHRNVQHHVRLIVTMVARCFLPFTAKCDGFHCQMARNGMHFSAVLISCNGMTVYICHHSSYTSYIFSSWIKLYEKFWLKFFLAIGEKFRQTSGIKSFNSHCICTLHQSVAVIMYALFSRVTGFVCVDCCGFASHCRQGREERVEVREYALTD